MLSETSGCHPKLSPGDPFPQLEHQKLKLSYRDDHVISQPLTSNKNIKDLKNSSLGLLSVKLGLLPPFGDRSLRVTETQEQLQALTARLLSSLSCYKCLK